MQATRPDPQAEGLIQRAMPYLTQKIMALISGRLREFKAEILAEIEKVREEMDEKGLERAKEVRQSMTLGTQQWEPRPVKLYSGSAVPDRGIGSNGDFYDRTNGVGNIAEKYEKQDGVWVSIGTFLSASTDPYVTNMSPSVTGFTNLDGVRDGVNKVFTTSVAYTENTLAVDRTGVTLHAGFGLTETDPSAGTVTFDTAPSASDQLRARFIPDV